MPLGRPLFNPAAMAAALRRRFLRVTWKGNSSTPLENVYLMCLIFIIQQHRLSNTLDSYVNLPSKMPKYLTRFLFNVLSMPELLDLTLWRLGHPSYSQGMGSVMVETDLTSGLGGLQVKEDGWGKGTTGVNRRAVLFGWDSLTSFGSRNWNR